MLQLRADSPGFVFHQDGALPHFHNENRGLRKHFAMNMSGMWNQGK
jgi:hypothetical protein